jgi:hypothetical protein
MESEPKNTVVKSQSWLEYYQSFAAILFPCNFMVKPQKKIVQVDKMTLLEHEEIK